MKKYDVLLIISLLAILSFPAQAETYRLVTAPFKPFADPKHPQGGFLVEITRQALALRGHQLQIDYKPWPRALQDAKNARYDGLLSAFYTDDRSKYFNFSAPLNTTKMVLVGLKNNMDITRYRSLGELMPYTIAIGRKWAYSEEFDSNRDLQKVTVPDEPSGIRMLFSNRFDLFAVNADQFHHAIAQMDGYDAHQTVILDPEISQNDQHIASAQSLPHSTQFLAEFNTGLAALRANGGYRRIQTQFFGF